MRFRHGVFRAPRQGPGTPPPLGPARAGPPSSALPPAPPAGQRPISEPPALEPPSPAAPVAQLCSDGLSSPLNSAWSLQYPDINGGPPVSPTPDNTKGAKSGASLPDGSLCGKWVVVKYRTPFLSFHGVAVQHQASPLPHPDSHKQKETKLSHPGRPPQTI